MGICLLNSIGGYAVLAREEILSPRTRAAASCRALLGRRSLIAATESLGRGRGLVDGCFEQILMIDGPPVIPFLNNLFAIQQHVAKNNSGRHSSSFLTIVNHKRVADVLRKRAVKLMLQVV